MLHCLFIKRVFAIVVILMSPAPKEP